MSKYYEIVIFTAAAKDYADTVLNDLDFGKNIKRRFYRESCTSEGSRFFKDLGKVNPENT